MGGGRWTWCAISNFWFWSGGRVCFELGSLLGGSPQDSGRVAKKTTRGRASGHGLELCQSPPRPAPPPTTTTTISDHHYHSHPPLPSFSPPSVLAVTTTHHPHQHLPLPVGATDTPAPAPASAPAPAPASPPEQARMILDRLPLGPAGSGRVG